MARGRAVALPALLLIAAVIAGLHTTTFAGHHGKTRARSASTVRYARVTTVDSEGRFRFVTGGATSAGTPYLPAEVSSLPEPLDKTRFFIGATALYVLSLVFNAQGFFNEAEPGWATAATGSWSGELGAFALAILAPLGLGVPVFQATEENRGFRNARFFVAINLLFLVSLLANSNGFFTLGAYSEAEVATGGAAGSLLGLFGGLFALQALYAGSATWFNSPDRVRNNGNIILALSASYVFSLAASFALFP